MDNVTEGMQNYGGKINAVETDLKKLGKYPFMYNDPLSKSYIYLHSP